MRYQRDLGEMDTLFGSVSGEPMPADLVGTRAALFYLLKTTPLAPSSSEGAATARVFRREVLRVHRPQSSPIREAAPPVQEASRSWRDILLEDTFDFISLQA